jgi:hypothetical protein
LFHPPLEALDRLLEHRPEAAIKLAPATPAPADWARRAELEWLGSRGECRQQIAWFGGLARHAGRRAATMVERGQVRTIVGTPDETVPVASNVGRYLYEPHAAVLAAQLTSAVCREHSLGTVHPGIAYLTGDVLVPEAALEAFAIDDELPLDRKQVQAYCRQRGLARLEVKKRGVELDPDQLRREIAARRGDGSATVIVCPVGPRVRAFITQRVRQSPVAAPHPPTSAEGE